MNGNLVGLDRNEGDSKRWQFFLCVWTNSIMRAHYRDMWTFFYGALFEFGSSWSFCMEKSSMSNSLIHGGKQSHMVWNDMKQREWHNLNFYLNYSVNWNFASPNSCHVDPILCKFSFINMDKMIPFPSGIQTHRCRWTAGWLDMLVSTGQCGWIELSPPT